MTANGHDSAGPQTDPYLKKHGRTLLIRLEEPREWCEEVDVDQVLTLAKLREGIMLAGDLDEVSIAQKWLQARQHLARVGGKVETGQEETQVSLGKEGLQIGHRSQLDGLLA